MSTVDNGSGWGGRRENQTGRPKISNGKRVVRAVSLTESRLDFMLDKYGARKLSQGIRDLIDLDKQATEAGIDLHELVNMAIESVKAEHFNQD